MGFPGGKPSYRRAHLDTDVLLAALGADADKDLVDEARQLFFSGKQLTPCACMAALGELVMSLAPERERMTDALRYLSDRTTQGHLVLFGLGEGSTEVFELAASIRMQDTIIDPADSLIVASFLEDQQSDVLYTTDAAILESRVIHELARGRGKNIRELA